jgi:membrane-bound lytic murein transglycosylase
MKARYSARRLLAPAALASATMLAACAGEPPTSEIGHARSAIGRAEADGAAQLAPAPLQTAHDKLGRAQVAVQSGDYTQARRMAEQADVDAEYADASSRAQRAEKTARELQSMQSAPQQPGSTQR